MALQGVRDKTSPLEFLFWVGFFFFLPEAEPGSLPEQSFFFHSPPPFYFYFYFNLTLLPRAFSDSSPHLLILALQGSSTLYPCAQRQVLCALPGC